MHKMNWKMNRYLSTLLGVFLVGLLARAEDQPRYTNDFEKTEVGSVPDEVMVLAGDFTVQSDGTNHFLELPGAPLDSFAVQFGPGGKEMAVEAQVFATSRGRRMPTFGVGLGGVSGWKLQVSPAKNAIELLKDQDSKATTEYAWKSGEWLRVKLRVSATAEEAWKIEGKVWPVGKPESEAITISHLDKESPVSGRASILASPFSGTPIRFDNLVVEPLVGK